MLTPTIMPVTAGKNIANICQNEAVEVGGVEKWGTTSAPDPPAKREIKDKAIIPKIANCILRAKSAPMYAMKPKARARTIDVICGSNVGKSEVKASVKPIM
jgi:hypothetical protein